MARRSRRPKHCGIYLISCTKNKTMYVGSSKDICMRWNSHLWDLINWKHCNSNLLLDWKKYGEQCFNFSIVEFVECQKQLRNREQFWMDRLRKEGKTLYNLKKA